MFEKAPMRRGATGCAAVFMLGASMSSALGQSALQIDADSFASEWNISGSSSTRLDRFDAFGDKDASAFPELGFQGFSDFNINFSRQISQFRSANGFIFGTFNASDTRARRDGFFPERANFTYIDGESFIPFRLELGDFFGFFSQRTIISTLKGVQTELQPTASLFGEFHSVQLFAGARAQDFRDENFGDNTAFGASWLVEYENSALSLNLAQNADRQNGGTVENLVYSAALNQRLNVSDTHDLTLDFELAHFNGEIAGNEGVFRTGSAIFLEARGNAQPFDYGMRFELTDQFFQPAGAAVTADRRSVELNSGYRLDSGIRVRGRAQMFRDGLQSGDPTDTYVLGVNLAGPLLREYVTGLNVNVDAFLQDVENRSKTSSNLTQVLNLNAALPVYDRLTGRFAVLYQSDTDRTNNDEVTLTRQFSATLSHPFNFFDGYRGSLSGGMIVRHVDAAATENFDWGPNLNLNVSRGDHNLTVGYNTLVQGASGNNATDTISNNLSTFYRYRTGPHQFSAEFRYVGRAPDPGDNVDSFKVGVGYTLSFNKPAVGSEPSRSGSGETAAAPEPGAGFPVQIGSLDFARIAPGTPFGLAGRNLEAMGVKAGVPFPDGFEYEEQIFDDIAERQRLALVADGGLSRVERVAVVIDLNQTTNGQEVQFIYETLRARLARSFGDPQTFEQGAFSDNLANDINAGQFIFNSEWRVDGGVLRIGFPRRLDGQVRMELQYAKALPPASETLWSVDSLN
jgi:hypothetical protein